MYKVVLGVSMGLPAPGADRQYFLGKLTKSGIPGWFLNKIGYFFVATGRAYARVQNASKPCSDAYTR